MTTSKPFACTLHVEERKQFERLLRLQGTDRMADRMVIVEAFHDEGVQRGDVGGARGAAGNAVRSAGGGQGVGQFFSSRA